MPVGVTDVRSNPNDQIRHAVKVLGKSKSRIAVFDEVYRGKKRIKTVIELMNATGLSRKRVLVEGKTLADNGIVGQVRHKDMTGYEKDKFYGSYKARILEFTKRPHELEKLPTKITPRITGMSNVPIYLPRQMIQTRQITVDDIDSFSRVRKIKNVPNIAPISEKSFKAGIQRIVGESGTFPDWGGEGNDLYTTRVKVFGRRIPTAFAFKGPGLRGKLTPTRMGKNGDQIHRLFMTSAEAFIVQHAGQVAESVPGLMGELAKAKSVSDGKQILYGIIDGDDTKRLIAAYDHAFTGTVRRKAVRPRTG